ncbi:hypothetical protein BD560DRAFT_330454, partial [Blakeslea trispora]
FIVGIVERTAQHYVKQYNDDEKKTPSWPKKMNSENRKARAYHADFLCSFIFAKKSKAVLNSYPQIEAINLSSIHRCRILYAPLTLKKLKPIVAARMAQRTLELRRWRVLEWLGDSSMHWGKSYIFIDEADFNMHIRRHFGRSKKGMPVKAVVPSSRGVTVIIILTICEKGVVQLTLRKPKAVGKKNNGTKKRKRDSGKADEVEMNARRHSK